MTRNDSSAPEVNAPLSRPAGRTRSILLPVLVVLATVFGAGAPATSAGTLPEPEAFAAPTAPSATTSDSYLLSRTTIRFNAGSYTFYRFSEAGTLLRRRVVSFDAAIRFLAGAHPVRIGERDFTRIEGGSWVGWYVATPQAAPSSVTRFDTPMQVRLAATRYAGLRFYSNGRISTRRVATLAAATTVTATKRATFGTRQFLYMSDGPLADRWVALSAVSTQQSSENVAPPTDTTVTTTWKTLVLVYRETDVTFTRSNGSRYRLQARISDAMYTKVTDALRRTTTSVNSWSGDLAAWDMKVVDVPHALTRVDPLGAGYWVGPDAVAADLDRYAPAGQYDSVVVVWQASDANGVEVPVGGWGLTMPPGPWANGAGFSSVITGGIWWWDRKYPEEVFVHEWMHQVLFFHEAAGRTNVDLHADAKYGYRLVDGSFKLWLSDVMQGRVWDGSRYLGVAPDDWRAATPTSR